MFRQHPVTHPGHNWQKPLKNLVQDLFVPLLGLGNQALHVTMGKYGIHQQSSRTSGSPPR
jgi:hypothetical protein